VSCYQRQGAGVVLDAAGEDSAALEMLQPFQSKDASWHSKMRQDASGFLSDMPEHGLQFQRTPAGGLSG